MRVGSKHDDRRTRRVGGGLVVAVALAIGGLAVVPPTPVSAALTCTHTWVGPTTGNWQVAANWSPAQIPGNAVGATNHVACIPAGRTVAINQGERQWMAGVLTSGTIVVNEGGKILLDADPAVGRSRIGRLELRPGSLLGGMGTVDITTRLLMRPGNFTATMTTRDTVSIPPSNPANKAAPTRFGVTVIKATAQLVVSDDSATGCAPYQNNGVNIRDGRRIVNYGTTIIEPCAYVAADWGTQYRNLGVAQLQGSLGWYEGFLRVDPDGETVIDDEGLGWPTTPPRFTNETAGLIQVTGVGQTFTMAARFAGTGAVSIAAGANLRILDPAAGVPATLSGDLGAGASGSLGTCLAAARGSCQIGSNPVQVSTLVNGSDPVGADLVSTAVGIGSSYGTSGTTVAGETFTVVTDGPAVAGDPYTVVITGGAGTKPASQYTAGSDGAVLPPCPALGAITSPCVASVTKSGSSVVIVVKATDLDDAIVPLGPRFFR